MTVHVHGMAKFSGVEHERKASDDTFFLLKHVILVYTDDAHQRCHVHDHKSAEALLQMSTGLNDHLFELREHYPENSPLLQTDQEL